MLLDNLKVQDMIINCIQIYVNEHLPYAVDMLGREYIYRVKFTEVFIRELNLKDLTLIKRIVNEVNFMDKADEMRKALSENSPNTFGKVISGLNFESPAINVLKIDIDEESKPINFDIPDSSYKKPELDIPSSPKKSISATNSCVLENAR
jgi:hypothetical protein